MATIDLGRVWEPFPAELEELRAALAELTGERPEKLTLQGVAGPNDIVEIILDFDAWPRVMRWLVEGIVIKLGEKATAAVWKNKAIYYQAVKAGASAPLLRLIKAIESLERREQAVYLAVKVPGTPRNVALRLKTDEPAKFLWQLANIARCAPEIREVVLAAVAANEISPPMNGNYEIIEVLGNGDVLILGTVISK